LSPGSALRYQFLLQGISKDWSTPVESRTADFARLPPGSYRLLGRAINTDGAVSSEPASLEFSVAAPLWRRWRFVLLAASAIGFGAYALHRHRLERALELANVRSRIATDLHDEIGSSLSRMAILSEVVQRQVEPTASSDSVRLLHDISVTARELVD